MSDGISEGYRASRAAKDFEALWEEARVEGLLFDLKSELSNLSVSELLVRLVDISFVEIKKVSRYLIHLENNSFYSESSYIRPVPPMVDVFEITVTTGKHRRFEDEDLAEALREALLYAEWLQTEEGKRAIEVAYDY